MVRKKCKKCAFFLRKDLQVSKKSLPLHPQSRKPRAKGRRKLGLRRVKIEVAKKSSKKIWWLRKKVLPLSPHSPQKNAAIFLAPRRKVGYQKRFFDLLVFKREKECRKHEVLKTSQVQFNSLKDRSSQDSNNTF